MRARREPTGLVKRHMPDRADRPQAEDQHLAEHADGAEEHHAETTEDAEAGGCRGGGAEPDGLEAADPAAEHLAGAEEGLEVADGRDVAATEEQLPTAEQQEHHDEAPHHHRGGGLGGPDVGHEVAAAAVVAAELGPHEGREAGAPPALERADVAVGRLAHGGEARCVGVGPTRRGAAFQRHAEPMSRAWRSRPRATDWTISMSASSSGDRGGADAGCRSVVDVRIARRR